MSAHGMERRVFELGEIRVRRKGSDAVTLSGYAATFNQPYKVRDFEEQIAPGAFDGTLKADVRALFNHDPNIVLGRTTNGTLRLSTDGQGLRTEIDLPDTSAARDLAVSVGRGDVSQMSFGFRVPEGGDSWQPRSGKPDLRTINAVELFDVSPVTFPANPNTTVAEARHRQWKAAGCPTGRCGGTWEPDEEMFRAIEGIDDVSAVEARVRLKRELTWQKEAGPIDADVVQTRIEQELRLGRNHLPIRDGWQRIFAEAGPGHRFSIPQERREEIALSMAGHRPQMCARHEAGHAIMCHLLSIEPRSVAIRFAKRGTRYVGGLATMSRMMPWQDGLISCAGEAAVEMFTGKPRFRMRRGPDLEDARRAAMEELRLSVVSCNFDENRVAERVQHYMDEARRLLAPHRTTIKRLGALLYKKRKLDRAELQRFLDRELPLGSWRDAYQPPEARLAAYG